MLLNSAKITFTEKPFGQTLQMSPGEVWQPTTVRAALRSQQTREALQYDEEGWGSRRKWKLYLRLCFKD